jgi:hypothetical protein
MPKPHILCGSRLIKTGYKIFRNTLYVRIFDFSEVEAKVNHFSVGGVFGGLSSRAWLGIN